MRVYICVLTAGWIPIIGEFLNESMAHFVRVHQNLKDNFRSPLFPVEYIMMGTNWWQDVKQMVSEPYINWDKLHF